jgi:TRAP-type mannitol/chloroaromatic compound transport system permease small subunit
MATTREITMRPLLALSYCIDLVNERIGNVCNWLVLAACVVSAGNAMIRYAFGYSSNGWLELQWYMFAILVMFGASYTFKRNEHVRVEIFYLFLSERGQLWLDLIGTLCFLIPACLLLAWLSWPFFHQAYAVGELSSNAGGLVRWPIKFVIPAGFVMLALQGVSEVIKRIAALQDLVTIDAKYERPMQ